MSDILLRCPTCRKTKAVHPESTDPASAAVCEIICLDCDRGDFCTPEFFDANGTWVPALSQQSLSIEEEDRP